MSRNLIPMRWDALSVSQQAELLARPPQSRDPKLRETVARIIDQVGADGDAALRALTRRFDGCELAELEVSAAEFEQAEAGVVRRTKQAIEEACARIEAFHRAGAPEAYALETAPGVRCERILRPIDPVGLYVPAGSAPLPSTAMMLGIPARLAGCREIIVCSPPNASGQIDPVLLLSARRAGATRVFKLGGVQAIAAMALGSASVPACRKLFGPGNAYVTEAKLQVSMRSAGPAIDMPAGPSEVLVVADAHANADFVAADLLSQAEHGPDSQAILLTDNAGLAERVAASVERLSQQLDRGSILDAALQHARLLLTRDIGEAIEVANRYAPEHLILNLDDARAWLPRVHAAGSVFLGAYSPEALGDYCSGTNHVLPTYGAAHAYSGVSVASFLKQITVQEVSEAGLRAIGPCAQHLANCEGLSAHELAVSCRLAALENAA
ncbi:histidinol dehydrogenase [Pseudomarimonas arenosa]|uniref:Histidinol dehydrogenase n=1 Tax=Pseudomarimonas arenosa TaxID=2774145 RepID=A0AAW3ZRJ2_9GAMM|nr:histidinol dehydrogenase [Pseudomarimonas arenosa]MBD8527694.1 histidinol dehydrogenase [Pseudomarimonas arenosa]